MRALQANKYWLVGCRKLVVETDAKYLKADAVPAAQELQSEIDAAFAPAIAAFN
ncbi:hypothetical protein J132_06739 [Termitomyces sp. J132]|nr:hypothetical protein J132_06739 [Termitomyces sp. J132]